MLSSYSLLSPLMHFTSSCLPFLKPTYHFWVQTNSGSRITTSVPLVDLKASHSPKLGVWWCSDMFSQVTSIHFLSIVGRSHRSGLFLISSSLAQRLYPLLGLDIGPELSLRLSPDIWCGTCQLFSWGQEPGSIYQSVAAHGWFVYK